MNNFDKVFEILNFSDRAEKSLYGFSNWIFSISLGICTLLILEFRYIADADISIQKAIFIGLVFFNMLNVFYVGYIKYLIVTRDTNLSVKFGGMKKLVGFKESKNNPDQFKKDWDKIFGEWVQVFNKLNLIGKLMNFSVITTVISVVTFGIFVLYILIY